MELKFNVIAIKQSECHFTLNPAFKAEMDRPISIGYGIKVSFEKKDKTVRVVVSVISDNKAQPFMFNIATEGLFTFNKLPQKMELEKVAHINCAAIIFPYIRESLADLTRRAGLTPFHIDPINFISIHGEMQKAQAQSNAKKRGKIGATK